MRATVKDRFTESLYFLDAALADATIAQNQRSQTHRDVPRRRTPTRSISRSRNVTLDELTAAPYKATVDFDQVYYGFGQPAGTQARDLRRPVDFVLRDQIPNAMVLVNPLGLTITYVRVDQAFQ